MAVNGEIELDWGDGRHKFNIARFKCIIELEEKSGVGVAEVLQRIRDGRWHYNDLRETLRLALIGAGMMPDKALTLVIRYCDERPWIESVRPAQLILFAGMVGVSGDEIQKKAEADRTAEDHSSTRMADSSDPPSTDSAPLSGSTRVN